MNLSYGRKLSRILAAEKNLSTASVTITKRTDAPSKEKGLTDRMYGRSRIQSGFSRNRNVEKLRKALEKWAAF